MTVHSIPIKSLRGSQPVLLLGERHCIKCKANWMRKAKYKPWQVLLNQKWILINTVTKWDTSEGFLSYDKKAGRDYVHTHCIHRIAGSCSWHLHELPFLLIWVITQPSFFFTRLIVWNGNEASSERFLLFNETKQNSPKSKSEKGGERERQMTTDCLTFDLGGGPGWPRRANRRCWFWLWTPAVIYVFLEPERRKSGLLKYSGYHLILICGSLACLHERRSKTRMLCGGHCTYKALS